MKRSFAVIVVRAYVRGGQVRVDEMLLMDGSEWVRGCSTAESADGDHKEGESWEAVKSTGGAN